jgi:hypothetical protein
MGSRLDDVLCIYLLVVNHRVLGEVYEAFVYVASQQRWIGSAWN